ncbi:dihydrolipoyl dehydrogenase [Agrobacterium cavarae]|uniref:dihydrolipoyl dehydrogenase n=1 Tax=Agrobacterium cavarae TaxID=2528239 RepID=UPI0028ACBEAB|nr:dihydrolipoyl dehydrogenase [Agrobacterium cavarae]
MTAKACKVLIIGGGPGGYVAAIRAGQLGLDTVLVEEGAVGGTCLNVGCIPSKALIHTAEVFSDACALAVDNPFGITSAAPQIDLARAVAWKDGIVSRLTGGVATLLRKARVNVLQGRAQIMDGKTVEVTATDGTVETLRCENLVIATGARAQTIPTLPFGGDVLSSTEVLALETVPKRLCVVGGGYIGLEIGTAMAKLGAQVTIVEAAPQLLPLYDGDLIKPVAKRLAALNVQVLTEARAQNYADGQLEVMVGDTRKLVAADKILVTVGRGPNIDGFGLETLGLDRNGRYLAVDGNCRTSMRGVYAVGDVTGEPMLAHRAMAQGDLVARVIAGEPVVWDKRAMPAVCFTDPEIVVVGQLPSQAGDAGVAIFPFAGNGRAMTQDRDDGFVRIVFTRESGLVLGIQAVGAGVSEMAGQFALALEMGATLTDIAATIQAHPTQSEAIQEAALKGLGMALHV